MRSFCSKLWNCMIASRLRYPYSSRTGLSKLRMREALPKVGVNLIPFNSLCFSCWWNLLEYWGWVGWRCWVCLHSIANSPNCYCTARSNSIIDPNLSMLVFSSVFTTAYGAISFFVIFSGSMLLRSSFTSGLSCSVFEGISGALDSSLLLKGSNLT